MSSWYWDSERLPWVAIVTLVAILIAARLAMPRGGPVGRRWGLILLRTGALMLLAWCLLDPARTVVEPVPGRNRIAVAVDRSRSMETPPGDGTSSVWERLEGELQEPDGWRARLEGRFQVTDFVIGERLRVHPSGSVWPPAAGVSPLFTQTTELASRVSGNPFAAIVLLTDGVATEPWPDEGRAWNGPPIFPVLLSPERETPDLRLTALTATPTLFEAAPLVVSATVEQEGLAGRPIVVRIVDQSTGIAVTRELELPEGGPAIVRIELPAASGSPVRLAADIRLSDEAGQWDERVESNSEVGVDAAEPAETRSIERTLANNRRELVVDRPTGPYRVLYVGGRPNWEFKFLRRAVQDDREVSLVGLLRMADREPRFAFLENGDARNRFYEGFRERSDERLEDYDEPVLVRIGTDGPEELAEGFPRRAADLFRYDAIVIDDVEAKFFDQEQLTLIRDFVERRGGGLLLLGGPRAFSEGEWSDTSFASLSPLYVQRQAGIVDERSIRWEPTREGWLAHWARLRSDESDERQARAGLPTLLGVNRVGAPKPAATVLALTDGGDPLLVAQEFGRGRTAALTASDLHRWQLLGERADGGSKREFGRLQEDFGRQWRQLFRWLVSDLPRRVAIRTADSTDSAQTTRELIVRVLSDEYLPDDQAFVPIEVTDPTGVRERLIARPAESPGEYRVTVPTVVEGEYRAEARVETFDGEPLGSATTGWIREPSIGELLASVADRERWQSFAERTGGRLLEPSELTSDSWIDRRTLSHVTTRERSLWHSWPLLLAALALLIGEWGWRRAKGLA